jgi:hypothetical protein
VYTLSSSIALSNLTLLDVTNFEMYLFFVSCLLGTATLRDQTYRRNLINDVYIDETGHVCEAIYAPLQLKVKAGVTESGHLLTADVKAKDVTLAWLIMVCAVRPMRTLLHTSTAADEIWGMSGTDDTLVSKAAWASRIQDVSRLHFGSPRTGTLWPAYVSVNHTFADECYLLRRITGHGAYRLMNITCKIYDIRRRYGGITEPGARSALLSHAHRCNTSLDTMLVRVCKPVCMSLCYDAY